MVTSSVEILDERRRGQMRGERALLEELRRLADRLQLQAAQKILAAYKPKEEPE